MNDRSSGVGVVIAVTAALVMFCLIVVGGAVMYVFTVRRTAMQTREAEAHARVQAEQARAEVEAVHYRRALEGANEIPVDQDTARQAIAAVLLAQSEAWNKGDIDQFMEHYWKSDDLTFSSGGKTTRGWEATLDRYRKRYPDQEKMGRLKFDNLEITILGDDAALVLGRWQLERAADPVSGNFSLVMRSLNKRWLITHDHTSTLEPATAP